LGDDDPVVYEAVHGQLLMQGAESVDWLRPLLLSPDPVLRRRAREIIGHFSRQIADTLFLEFCLKQGEDLDLETGAWLLATTQFPDINVEGYRAVLDDFASDIRERLPLSGDAEEMLRGINRYVFGTLGFHGNEENYYDPDNSYLNRVIDRRTGNPISMCLTYLLLARRLKLPVTGIGLPGHFICRFQSSAAEIFIDPFNAGRLLSKADCVHYLLQGNFSVRDDYLAPVSPRRLLLRICANLHQIYLRQELDQETTRLQRYLVALTR
jgi:regulator of sirC expression with transglutaminase-like and TPR domain